MEIKKLHVLTFPEALKNMEVGETSIAPKEYGDKYVRRLISSLKKEGYLFSSTTATGELVITRLK